MFIKFLSEDNLQRQTIYANFHDLNDLLCKQFSPVHVLLTPLLGTLGLHFVLRLILHS